MKFRFLGLAVMGLAFWGASLQAANMTMNPGETIVVPPSVEATRVFCVNSNPVNVIESYCVCVDPGIHYMKRLQKVYVMSDGNVQTVFLGNYNDTLACSFAKDNQAACSPK